MYNIMADPFVLQMDLSATFELTYSVSTTKLDTLAATYLSEGQIACAIPQAEQSYAIRVSVCACVRVCVFLCLCLCQCVSKCVNDASRECRCVSIYVNSVSICVDVCQCVSMCVSM